MNNVDFVTSIKIEQHFEHIVKQIVAHIYDAEAYLTGGPYDGGRDLIYKRQGVEVKEAVGITIQESNIEAKILGDAKKVKKLVTEHNYPNKFTFFWSQTLTASKKAKIRKSVRDETNIELEIYDAHEIEQIISDDYPDILNYLIETVHGYTKKNDIDIDIRAKTLYDYLALSKDAAQAKESIVDAHLISSLFSAEKDKELLITEITSLGYKKGTASNRIGKLLNSGKVTTTDEGLLKLSPIERARIELVINKDTALKTELINTLDSYTKANIGTELGEEVLRLIKSVYEASNDIQLSDADFEPPKIALAKSAFGKIEYLVKDSKQMTSAQANIIAKELIELTSTNDYFSNFCSSMLCVGLFNQKKLEKYLKDKSTFIYLDTPVFIRYIALFKFSNTKYLDRELKTVSRLKETIKNKSESQIMVTGEHLEETIRHITQAEKIHSFANDDLIAKFGDSKNVYFNIYLRAKKLEGNGYNFDKFLEELIGYESTQSSENKFAAYQSCVARLLTLANIKIETVDPNIESTPQFLKVLRKYESHLNFGGKHRSRRAVSNDVKACYVLGDISRHTDKNGIGHIPMLVTWDGMYPKLKDYYRTEFPLSDWIIHSPFRALERIDMIDFKVSPSVLKDNVLAILDEDYLRESSLIDTLEVFLGDDRVESDHILALLSKISGRTLAEKNTPFEFEVETRNALSEMLLALHHSLRDSMKDVRRLFAEKEKESDLLDIINEYLSKGALDAAVANIKQMSIDLSASLQAN
jgi:hypothetical protein